MVNSSTRISQGWSIVDKDFARMVNSSARISQGWSIVDKDFARMVNSRQGFRKDGQ